MSQDFDLVIRNGTVIDGSGAEPFVADVALAAGKVAAVGSVEARGREELDASGLLVTPGFVDIHTHYDGQVTWEHRCIPSSSHGVTTVVMGNCGVGFAPCRPQEHELLIRLMEGVEDIPHPVMVEGVPWTWESFPEYMDFLAAREYDMDLCAQVPHAALRVYVMGERGANRETATASDIARMAALLEEAIASGAIGVSTSRTFFHRSSDGRSIPTLDVAEEELTGLAETLKACGRGVIQLITDFEEPEAAFACMRHLVERSGRPLSFSLLEGVLGPLSPRWPEILEWIGQANAEGLPIKGQVLGRAIGLLFGHELTLNPFYSTETYRSLAHLPFDARISELRRPEVRARILSEPIDPNPANVLGKLVRRFDHMYQLGDPPDYEPLPETSVRAQAVQRGMSPEALAYDLLLERDGHNLLYDTNANYAHGSLDSCYTMMQHPDTVLGLGDGGAHCGTVCDASSTTFMLTHWGRDRSRGPKLPLSWIVRALCRETAQAVGLLDRGLLARGYKADVNIIDLEGLRLGPPEIAHDLPGGGRRLVQHAEGYVATIVGGTVVDREGEPTGALPGRLVRGPQAAPH